MKGQSLVKQSSVGPTALLIILIAIAIPVSLDAYTMLQSTDCWKENTTMIDQRIGNNTQLELPCENCLIVETSETTIFLQKQHSLLEQFNPPEKVQVEYCSYGKSKDKVLRGISKP